jgi:hypothetical protein
LQEQEKKKLYIKAAMAVLLSLTLGTAGFHMGKQADAMEAQNLSFKNWSVRHGPMASTAGWTGEGTMTGPEAFQEAGLLVEETSEKADPLEQDEKIRTEHISAKGSFAQLLKMFDIINKNVEGTSFELRHVVREGNILRISGELRTFRSRGNYAEKKYSTDRPHGNGKEPRSTDSG